jgi:hypothetical protein
MATDKARSRCRERLLRIAEVGVDAETLRRELVDELRATVGFAAWGWPLADHDSLLPTTEIADGAMWPVVSKIVDYEERAPDVNNDRDLARSGIPVGILSAATGGDLQRSSRWRDILGGHGLGMSRAPRVSIAMAAGATYGSTATPAARRSMLPTRICSAT